MMAITALQLNNHLFLRAISTPVIRGTFLVDGSVRIVKARIRFALCGSIRIRQTPLPSCNELARSLRSLDGRNTITTSDHSKISFPKSDNSILIFIRATINYESFDATRMQSAIFDLFLLRHGLLSANTAAEQHPSIVFGQTQLFTLFFLSLFLFLNINIL